MQPLDMFSIITIALFGSFAHCSGMCGGFIVALSFNHLRKDHSLLHKNLLHLIYHTGRISAYILIGLIAVITVELITFNTYIKGIIFILIAFVMFLMGHSMLGKSRFLQTLEKYSPFATYIQTIVRRRLAEKGRFNLFFLGVLNGFLPCGFVYFFALSAAATHDFIDAGVVMLIFGLSTLPILLAIANASALVQKYNLRNKAMMIAGWIVIVYGYVMLYKAYLLFTHPVMTCH